MQAKKYRWSRDYESAEEELIDLLAAKNITAHRTVIEDQDEITEQISAHQVIIWCAEGSINFMVAGTRYHLQSGDTLQIPANTTYYAIAGFTGCVIYQSM